MLSKTLKYNLPGSSPCSLSAPGRPNLVDQMVDAGKDVPCISHPEIADVERPERLTVPGAAAVVDFENQRATTRPDVDRVRPPLSEVRPVDARRTAMDHAQQRMLDVGIRRFAG